MNNNYNSLVISGGGLKGLSALGYLQAAINEHAFNLDEIKYYSGTSIGSIICLLLCCGYTPSELYTKFLSTNTLLPINVFSLGVEYGCCSFDIMLKEVQDLVVEKIGYIPTFYTLFKLTGKSLYMCTCNITTKKIEYLSYKTHPDLNCILGCKMSSTLPIIHFKCELNSNLYIDGGLGNNCPIEPILSEDKPKILVLSLKTNKTSPEIIDFFAYLKACVSFPLSIIDKYDSKKYEGMNDIDIIVLDVKCDDPLKFTVNKQEKITLFVSGYDYFINNQT